MHLLFSAEQAACSSGDQVCCHQKQIKTEKPSITTPVPGVHLSGAHEVSSAPTSAPVTVTKKPPVLCSAFDKNGYECVPKENCDRMKTSVRSSASRNNAENAICTGKKIMTPGIMAPVSDGSSVFKIRFDEDMVDSSSVCCHEDDIKNQEPPEPISSPVTVTKESPLQCSAFNRDGYECVPKEECDSVKTSIRTSRSRNNAKNAICTGQVNAPDSIKPRTDGSNIFKIRSDQDMADSQLVCCHQDDMKKSPVLTSPSITDTKQQNVLCSAFEKDGYVCVLQEKCDRVKTSIRTSRSRNNADSAICTGQANDLVDSSSVCCHQDDIKKQACGPCPAYICEPACASQLMHLRLRFSALLLF